MRPPPLALRGTYQRETDRLGDPSPVFSTRKHYPSNADIARRAAGKRQLVFGGELRR